MGRLGSGHGTVMYSVLSESNNQHFFGTAEWVALRIRASQVDYPEKTHSDKEIAREIKENRLPSFSCIRVISNSSDGLFLRSLNDTPIRAVEYAKQMRRLMRLTK